jgi:hypothetical protein
MQAQHFGAVGAILYNDPADYAPFGTSPDQVYNETWYMPPSGTQRGSSYTSDGDPLTPVYPSTGLTLFWFSVIGNELYLYTIDYMYRVNEESVRFLPKIPAQPIGYSEAQVILQ